jgi:hypothetical protein
VPYAHHVAGLAGLLLHLRRISLFDHPGGEGFRNGEPGDPYQISTIRGPLLRLAVAHFNSSQLTESVLARLGFLLFGYIKVKE